jgi:hypothetical protein
MMVIQASSKDLYPLMDRWRKGPMRAEIARDEEVWMTMPVYRARPRDDEDA